MQYQDRKRKAGFSFYFLTLGKWALLPTFPFLVQTNQQSPKWSDISDGASLNALWPRKTHTSIYCYRRDDVSAVVQRTGKEKNPNGQTLQILTCCKFLTLKSIVLWWLVWFFSGSPPFLQCNNEIQPWNNEKAWPKNVIEDNILKYLHYNKAKSFFLVHTVVVSVGQVSKPSWKNIGEKAVK